MRLGMGRVMKFNDGPGYNATEFLQIIANLFFLGGGGGKILTARLSCLLLQLQHLIFIYFFVIFSFPHSLYTTNSTKFKGL